MEALVARPDELAVDDEVGRRRDQRHHPADQRGDAERHHQAAGRDRRSAGDPQHGREEDGDDPVELITEPIPATTAINKAMSRVSLLPAAADQEIAEPLRDPRADQPFPDDKERADQDDVGITQARERLRDRDRPR